MMARKPREPSRYSAPKLQEHVAAPAVVLRCDPLELEGEDYSAPARAVLEAKPSTCRFVRGERESFRFCGAQATVVAGGALTYCAGCAAIVYAPSVRITSQTSPVPAAAPTPFMSGWQRARP